MKSQNKYAISKIKITAIFFLVAFLFFFNPREARAEVYEAKSCDDWDIQASLDLSKSGDVVAVSSEDNYWCDLRMASYLKIPRGVCLYIGNAGVTNACNKETKASLDAYYFKKYSGAFQLVGFLIFLFVSLYLFSRVEEEKKKKLIWWAVNFSPLWLSSLLIFVISRVNSYAHGQVDIFWDSLAIIVAVFLLLPLYYTMAVQPAASAHWIVKSFNDKSREEKKRKTITLWKMLDRVKRERWGIIIILISLIIFFLLADIYLLNKFNPQSVLQAISVAALFFYVLFKFFSYGRVDILRTNHQKESELKKAVDKLAITTGVTAPNFQILAHDNPTAFSLYSNFGKPTIYITASLLNIANKDELEAIVAHEFAHIYSGRMLYLKRLYDLLIILKTLGFFMLFLVFIALSPWLIFLWALFLFPAVINPATDRDIISGENLSILIANANVFNPPYAVVNFISYLMYYSIAQNEEYYNDLKTVEFTRYPEGIYSIIRKVENYQGGKSILPKKYDYLYFTGQDMIFNEIPAPQPSAQDRESNLEQIDNVLVDDKKTAGGEKIICPNCQSLMKNTMVEGFYCNPLRSNYCEKCDSFWFDGSSFWNVWDLQEKDINKTNPEKPVEIEVKDPSGLACPRCGVKLGLHEDKELVPEINIWRCQICNGNWLSRKDAIEFFNYRRKFIKEKNETARNIQENEDLLSKQLIGSQSPGMLLKMNKRKVEKKDTEEEWI